MLHDPGCKMHDGQNARWTGATGFFFLSPQRGEGLP
jgi:hypothetical protein